MTQLGEVYNFYTYNVTTSNLLNIKLIFTDLFRFLK